MAEGRARLQEAARVVRAVAHIGCLVGYVVGFTHSRRARGARLDRVGVELAEFRRRGLFDDASELVIGHLDPFADYRHAPAREVRRDGRPLRKSGALPGLLEGEIFRRARWHLPLLVPLVFLTKPQRMV